MSARSPATPGAPTQAPGAVADVALLLEGTYPYVRGGVSSWVHDIIRSLPEFTFSLTFLGGNAGMYGSMGYELPKNVVHLERHFLMEPGEAAASRPHRAGEAAFADSRALHEALRTQGAPLPDEALERLASTLGARGGITEAQFLHSRLSWDEICSSYRRFCTDPSFLDYFWTVRLMHGPLFTLADVARRLPAFRMVHTVSTGYAGMLGLLLQKQRGRPVLLTEHGIYTKERKIDLSQAEWIRDAREPLGRSLNDDSGYIRQLWIRFFEGLGKLTYSAANPIISLYEDNRRRQILDGAEAARTRIIPNGVDVRRFAALRERRPAGIPKVIGLIGRVVPIKDVRTFIRAMRTVCTREPDTQGLIVGPEEEDPSYAAECRELVSSLGLGDRITFLGFRTPEEILPRLGVLVLTSISEALPLVILEGFASGLPAVATDVGSCRELIEGSDRPGDRDLGSAGAVAPVADSESFAEAILELLRDEPRWRRAQAAGIARVERFYTMEQMIDSYRALYQEGCAWRE